MPIEPKRVEAAARGLAQVLDSERALMWAEDGWACIDGIVKPDEIVAAVLAAAFPELASDPPTAWVAPWEATEAMGHEIFMHGEDVWSMWQRARDAYTKEQT